MSRAENNGEVKETAVSRDIIEWFFSLNIYGASERSVLMAIILDALRLGPLFEDEVYPLTLDEIIRVTGLDETNVNEALSNLDLAGVIHAECVRSTWGSKQYLYWGLQNTSYVRARIAASRSEGAL